MDLKLVAENAVTGYPNFSVNNINFTLVSNDIFGLLGRSGSGKSTIINTIVKLLKIKEGTITIYVNGKESKAQKIIGYSPQKNSLYEFLTIEENLRTFARLYDIPNKDIDERIDNLLKRLDLFEHKHKRISQLSGGMEKRADLAITLIHNPAIIILDEPFNGLDISLQNFIWDFLKELASQGRIVIITSHLLEDIQKYCNKFGLIHNNKYHDTNEIKAELKKRNNISLERFLENLFKNKNVNIFNQSKS